MKKKPYKLPLGCVYFSESRVYVCFFVKCTITFWTNWINYEALFFYCICSSCKTIHFHRKCSWNTSNHIFLVSLALFFFHIYSTDWYLMPGVASLKNKRLNRFKARNYDHNLSHSIRLIYLGGLRLYYISLWAQASLSQSNHKVSLDKIKKKLIK